MKSVLYSRRKHSHERSVSVRDILNQDLDNKKKSAMLIAGGQSFKARATTNAKTGAKKKQNKTKTTSQDSVAQMVEHLPMHQKVTWSVPSQVTCP